MTIGGVDVHFCSPWSGPCKMGGLRLNLVSTTRYVGIAFTPESRFGVLGGKSKWVTTHTTKGKR